MGYIGQYSLSARVGAEVIGSTMVYLLGVGAVANALLPRAKGQGMGFLSIALAAGLGILIPIIVFQRVSGWFNPSFLIALWVRGQLSAGDFFALFAAELAGYFIGAVLLWVHYLPHFNAAVDPPACSEVERLLTDPALLTEPALLNASYGLDLPRITSPKGLWDFFLGELRKELAQVAHAQRLADPVAPCKASMRAVHAAHPSSNSSPAPPRATHPEAGAASPAAAAVAATVAGGGGGPASDVEAPAVAGAAGATARAHPRECASSGSASLARSSSASEGKQGGEEWGLGCSPALPPATLAQKLGMEADKRSRVVVALTKARQDVVLSTFATRPAVFSPLLNLIQEFLATGLLVTLCLMVIEQAGFLTGDIPSLWASQSALYACCTQTLVILALGGPTGPALNAARDFAPRLAHQLLPIPGKGCSEWYYGWVPVIGTLAGGAAAGSLVEALTRLLKLD